MQIDPVELPNLEGSEMQPESKEQIRQQRVPIPGSLVPGDVANDTRGYVERFVEQVNGCYREGWYDASAIMIRRLLEVLIIDSFEAIGRLSDISETKHWSVSSEVSEPPTVAEQRRFEDDIRYLEVAVRDVLVSIGVLLPTSPASALVVAWDLLNTRYHCPPPDDISRAVSVLVETREQVRSSRSPALSRECLRECKRGMLQILSYLHREFPSAGVDPPTSGEIVPLTKLVERYLTVPESYWHVERTARRELRKMKEVGDVGAHGRHRKVTKQYLDKYQDQLIAVIQQLVGTAYGHRSR